MTSWELWDRLAVASWFSPSLRLMMSYGLLSLPVCESIDLPARAVLLPARASDALSPLRRSHTASRRCRESWGRAAWMSAALSLSPPASLSLSSSFPLSPKVSALCHCAYSTLSSVCLSFRLLSLMLPHHLFSVSSLIFLSLSFSVLILDCVLGRVGQPLVAAFLLSQNSICDK